MMTIEMRPGKNIVQVLGTASSSGKSTIAMALCRFFSDQGLAVSPFKSVNMSLNSISIEGGYEIARSQWLQAVASRTKPLKEMNPILLKPEGDGRSQLIVLGRSMGSMSYPEYGRFLETDGRSIVRESIDYLASRYDVIVAEGAGSPAEINLYRRDLANTYVSSIYGTPALLVADIERGGAFASILGTVSLMEHPELLRWIVINKMRGSSELLADGIRRIQEMTHLKVIGIMPFTEFHLPGEDSLDYAKSDVNDGGICVVKYPHMENYSDVDPLVMSSAGFSYVDSLPADGKLRCRTIILPGSKNVQEDLQFLRDTGLDGALIEHARHGGTLLGICGGYQMLGEEIADPDHIEFSVDRVEGLGLLRCRTDYATRKTVGTVNFRSLDADPISGKWNHGYQIHFGVVATEEKPMLMTDDGPEGSISREGNVLGTNVHGVLEDPYFLRMVTGIPGTIDFRSEIERNIDLFTKAFIENVDLNEVKNALLPTAPARKGLSAETA